MGEWIKVIYGLVMSLLLGFVIGWVLCKLLTILCAAMDRRKTNRFFKAAQIFGAAAHELYCTARRIGQKFIGVLFLGVAFSNGQSSVSGMAVPVWLMLLCSVVMGLGTSVGGEKIIKSVGMDMVKLEKYQGFALRPVRRCVPAAVQFVRDPSVYYPYQDQCHHGSGGGSRDCLPSIFLW